VELPAWLAGAAVKTGLTTVAGVAGFVLFLSIVGPR